MLFEEFELLDVFGLLDGRRATTNKRAFEWVASQIFTSSGVSAGIDMSLALIARLLGEETAEQVANSAEYEWHRDSAWDPFAIHCGLL
jgi:transcriptional regulator GlxA family with amidase domain